MGRPTNLEIERRKLVLDSLGLDRNDYHDWYLKYEGLRCSDNIVLLTLEEYLKLAAESGIKKPSEIGRRMDKYQMGRIGDSGNYELGNCRFITMSQNMKERSDNGGSLKGRTKETCPGVAKMAESKSRNYQLKRLQMKQQNKEL